MNVNYFGLQELFPNLVEFLLKIELLWTDLPLDIYAFAHQRRFNVSRVFGWLYSPQWWKRRWYTYKRTVCLHCTHIRQILWRNEWGAIRQFECWCFSLYPARYIRWCDDVLDACVCVFTQTIERINRRVRLRIFLSDALQSKSIIRFILKFKYYKIQYETSIIRTT